MILAIIIFSSRVALSEDLPVDDFEQVSNDEDSLGEDISDQIAVDEIEEPPVQYNYVPDNRSNFFIPPITQKVYELQPESQEIPIVSPLQEIELADLGLVGVWKSTADQPRALLLETGKPSGHIVEEGDLVGPNSGKVKKIFLTSPEHILVQSYKLSFDGSRKYSETKIYLDKLGEAADASKVGTKYSLPESPVPASPGSGSEDPGSSQISNDSTIENPASPVGLNDTEVNNPPNSATPPKAPNFEIQPGVTRSN